MHERHRQNRQTMVWKHRVHRFTNGHPKNSPLFRFLTAHTFHIWSLSLVHQHHSSIRYHMLYFVSGTSSMFHSVNLIPVSPADCSSYTCYIDCSLLFQRSTSITLSLTLLTLDLLTLTRLTLNLTLLTVALTFRIVGQYCRYLDFLRPRPFVPKSERSTPYILPRTFCSQEHSFPTTIIGKSFRS